MARKPSIAEETSEDPRDGYVIGVAAYAEGVHEARRFDEVRNKPGSGTGDAKFQVTVICHTPRLIDMAKSSVTAAIRAVIDDTYPNAAKLPARGLRGVKREPLIKPVIDYPKLWPECPNPDAIFVRAGSKDAPFLADENGEALSPDAAKVLIKSGVFIRIMFRAYHYETGGDPGISLGLNAVQYLRPGYKLGRFVDTEVLKKGVDDSVFADIDI